MSWFLYFTLLIILLSALSSLRAFRLELPFIFKSFSLFLCFTTMAEIFGVAWSRKLYQFTSFTRSNQWFYTIFHFVSYLFYLRFFYEILQLPSARKTIGIVAIFYILFALVNYLFVQGPHQLNTYTDLLACFIMVYLSVAYFYQLLYAREIIHLTRDMVFWISTGLLIYHLGSMMGIFLINVMDVISNERARSIHIIIQVAALLMYLNYSIAFLCAKRK